MHLSEVNRDKFYSTNSKGRVLDFIWFEYRLKLQPIFGCTSVVVPRLPPSKAITQKHVVTVSLKVVRQPVLMRDLRLPP
jgi:hypothetical protein